MTATAWSLVCLGAWHCDMRLLAGNPFITRVHAPPQLHRFVNDTQPMTCVERSASISLCYSAGEHNISDMFPATQTAVEHRGIAPVGRFTRLPSLSEL